MKNDDRCKYTSSEVVGLVPAAGFATRISPIPCSKEIYPVSITESDESDGVKRTRAISSYLLDRMRAAGVSCIYMIIREGKWDIPDYYRQNEPSGINLAYLVTGPTAGVPYTLDVAYPFLRDKKIVFGFPDIFFEPRDAYKKLLDKQADSSADLVLGLYSAVNTENEDMVELSDKNIQNIIIKPHQSTLPYTWMNAVWAPTFTEFLHSFLIDLKNDAFASELHLGDIINEAIKAGLDVKPVLFEDSHYLDIGTPSNLKKVDSL